MLKFNKGGKNMKTNKKVMRTVEEKAKIIEEYLSWEHGLHYYERKYNIHYQVLHKWYNKYLAEGIVGLESKTGKKKGGTKGKGAKKVKTREDELERKIMQLEIENARLKKGYLVKGGGAQKEYVTTLDENTK